MANTTHAYSDWCRNGSGGVMPRTPSATSSAASGAETPPHLLARSKESKLQHAWLHLANQGAAEGGRGLDEAHRLSLEPVDETRLAKAKVAAWIKGTRRAIYTLCRWAYARMGRVGLSYRLEERILQVVADFTSQDIADTKSAYSQLGAGLFCLVLAGAGCAFCTRAFCDAAVLGCRLLLWALTLLWSLFRGIWPSSHMAPAVALAGAVWGVSSGCSAPWGLMCAAIVVFCKSISDARARSSEWRRTLLD